MLYRNVIPIIQLSVKRNVVTAQSKGWKARNTDLPASLL